jgi:hypothetical protein
MIKKIIVIQLVLVFLCTVHLHSKKDEDNRAYWNNRISSAPNTAEKFNLLGEKIVEDLKAQVEYIIAKDKWTEYRLFNQKINLLVSLKKIDKKEMEALRGLKEDEKFPLEKVFDIKKVYCLELYAYDLLSGALKSAIEKDTKLKKYITILSVDTESLKEAIMETEDPIYKPTGRLKYGEMQALNANYYCTFKILRKAGKFIFNSGHANLIEKGHEIGNTANFEFKARELFEECETKSTPAGLLPNPGMFDAAGAGKIKPLNNPVTWYRTGSNLEWKTIAPGATVRSGGEISFALDLPVKRGYLLIFLMDQRGKPVNLFPGTKKALRNKRYNVPDDLYNPTTEVLQDSAEGTRTSFGRLDTGQVQTAVYTFDNNPGKETFYFYYSSKIDAQLEEFLSKAADTGKNIKEIKTKGIEDQTKVFDGKRMPEGKYFLHAFKLNLEHE